MLHLLAKTLIERVQKVAMEKENGDTLQQEFDGRL